MRVPLPLENGVLLRDFVPEDAELLQVIEYDPEVKKYLGIPQKSPAQWLQEFRAGIGQHVSFAVVAVPERELAGRASFSRCVPNLDDRDLSIVIAKRFWGRGLGEIVSQMLIREGRKMGVRSITATVHPENRASLDLLSRHRFVFSAVVTDGPAWQKGHHLYVRAAGA